MTVNFWWNSKSHTCHLVHQLNCKREVCLCFMLDYWSSVKVPPLLSYLLLQSIRNRTGNAGWAIKSHQVDLMLSLAAVYPLPDSASLATGRRRTDRFHLFRVNTAYHLHKVWSNLGRSEVNKPTISPAAGGHEALLVTDGGFALQIVFLFFPLRFTSSSFSPPPSPNDF